MYATVVVNRDRKKRVTYNSGRIYFKEKSSVELFLEEAEARGLEAYEIRLKQPLHEVTSTGDGYFCPYCGQWEYWIAQEDSAKHCPICGISDHDYYVKNANDLWLSGMATKKSQKQKAKTRRRREKADV